MKEAVESEQPNGNGRNGQSDDVIQKKVPLSPLKQDRKHIALD